MADLATAHPAPATTALPTPPSASEGRVIKRRNRIPISCGACRTRRSKCDRAQPSCGACDKRGESHLCHYAKPTDRIGKPSETDGRRHTGHSAQDRLQQIENLVMQLVGKDPNAAPGGSGYQEANSGGYQNSGSTFQDAGYTGGGPEASQPHWAAVLNGIQDLRNAIQHEEGSPEPPDGILDLQDRPILLAVPRPQSLSSTLSEYLPTRDECDRMLTRYFRTPYLTIPVVHTSSFEEQYRQFWVAPGSADPIWCGLLFALLSLSAHINHVAGVTSDEGHHAERFAHAAAACIHIVGYTRPRPHLLPALLLLGQSIYLQNYDPSREVALMLSDATRLAYQSGLHRDPSQSSTVSVFDAEMNRRLWTMIRHFDLQLASQFGVPASIPYNSHDVNEPRNLADNDLSPLMAVLPPSRPDIESTPVTTFIIKHRLMDVFAEIYYHACSVRETLSDGQIQRLDNEIRVRREAIPQHYQSRPVESSFTVEQHIIMARITYELLAQKALCILHRRRMTQGNADSRAKCMQAAASIIETMTNFVDSLQPGQPLEGNAWMISSTNVNDFLLGCMILCAGVFIDDKVKKSSKELLKEKEENVRLLVKARLLCLTLSEKSRGARKAREVINVLLAKMGLERDDNVDPNLGSVRGQALPTPQSQGYGGVGEAHNMPMSNDAMSSLAAAAAQLSPDSGFSMSPSQPSLTAQTYGGSGYSFANAPEGSNQGIYPGTYQSPAGLSGSGQAGIHGQTHVPIVDPFEQLFAGVGGGQDEGGAGVDEKRGEIDWAAFDQFLTAGDLGTWE